VATSKAYFFMEMDDMDLKFFLSLATPLERTYRKMMATSFALCMTRTLGMAILT